MLQAELTDDGIFELIWLIDIEQLARAQRKSHAFIVLLELVVDFGRHKSCEFPLRKCIIFVQGLSVMFVSVGIKSEHSITFHEPL